MLAACRFFSECSGDFRSHLQLGMCSLEKRFRFCFEHITNPRLPKAWLRLYAVPAAFLLRSPALVSCRCRYWPRPSEGMSNFWTKFSRGLCRNRHHVHAHPLHPCRRRWSETDNHPCNRFQRTALSDGCSCSPPPLSILSQFSDRFTFHFPLSTFHFKGHRSRHPALDRVHAHLRLRQRFAPSVHAGDERAFRRASGR